MMAFARLEPFGSLHEEMMAGQIAAVTANAHRGAKTEPFTPSNFFGALARELGEGPEAPPILLDDPEAQSELIMRHVFGKTSGG